MEAAQSILTATQANSADMLNMFEMHTSARRVDTKTTILRNMRSYYRDYHVTEVEEKRVSLFEFAASDKASLTLDAENEKFNSTRDWTAVGEGVDKDVHPGKLRDDFRFARFQYIWDDKEYLVYYVTWQDMLKSPDKLFYILRSRNESTIIDGHCTETDALVLAAGKWSSQLHEEIFVFDDGRWEKSKELWRSVNGSSWDDVILDPEMKKGLIEDVQGFFNNQAIYKDFAVPWKRGIILHGVPGNGKTVSIKALTSSLHARSNSIPSLYVKCFETNCNTKQYAIRTIFQMARRMAPCLLIFEDLDSLVNDEIRSYFLNEVDGLESNDGILMIGSTNHLDKLDPAISKRPSRFDRKYHFEIPGNEERRLYAEYWRNKLTKNETVDFPADLAVIVSQLTEGFSFAYMKELFIMALLSLVRGFTSDDFEVIDAAEAASADDEPTDPTAKPTDNKEETCSCATKCNYCNKPLPQKASNSPEAKKTADAAQAALELNKNKLVMPSVDVPAHLEDNLLLKIIKHQIRILHKEMDNTKDESGGKTEVSSGSGKRPAVRRVIKARAC